MDFPRISAADLAEAVRPLTHEEAGQVTSRLDRWRSENPDTYRGWSTMFGCVIQMWGVRMYYGRCKDCGARVMCRRDVSQYRSGQTNLGRWQERCADCVRRKGEGHNGNARHRMARLRRDRAAFRDAQMVDAGMTPPRQGVPAQGCTEAYKDMRRSSPSWQPEDEAMWEHAYVTPPGFKPLD